MKFQKNLLQNVHKFCYLRNISLKKSLAAFSSNVDFKCKEVDGNILHNKAFASAVNNAFIATTNPYSEYYKLPIEELGDPYIIFDISIQYCLKGIKSNEAPGPDGLPNWIPKSFSMDFSEPVTIMVITFIKQAKVQCCGELKTRKCHPSSKVSSSNKLISLTVIHNTGIVSISKG